MPPTEGVRQATSADLPALVELAKALRLDLEGERGGAIWRQREGRADPLAASIQGDLDDASARVVLASFDDVPAGYAVGRLERLHNGSTMVQVGDLFVDPDYRELGLGEQLLDDLIAWARRNGAIGIDALALPGMRHSKNFFESFGLVARAIVVHRDLRST